MDKKVNGDKGPDIQTQPLLNLFKEWIKNYKDIYQEVERSLCRSNFIKSTSQNSTDKT